MNLFNRIIRRLHASIISEYVLRRELNTVKFYCRRIALEDKILNSTEIGIVPVKQGDVPVVVSLTTHGKRINDVCFTIESLMQQTVKANKIVLWLDDRLKDSPLPQSLVRQQARGLEVRYTKDIRSYTKLIPALREYPDSIIITVDDDVAYDFDLIEKLTNAYQSEPACIHACRVLTMAFNRGGDLKPYNDWRYSESIPALHFLTGIGGVLYPPHSLHKEVMNKEVFTSICPKGDDIWFTAMAKLNHTPIKKVVTRDPIGDEFVNNDKVQDMALDLVNRGQKFNDTQIKAVFAKYGIYDLIREQQMSGE